MPEATMNEYDSAAGREYKIGAAWQGPAMKPIAIAHRGEQSTHNHFRAGVFATYGRHAPGALLRRQNVHGQTFTSLPAQSMNSATFTSFTPETFG